MFNQKLFTNDIKMAVQQSVGLVDQESTHTGGEAQRSEGKF
jgi:hypothetical protein